MQLKENLVNTALLGTGKKQVTVNELPDALQAEASKLWNDENDNETKFLNICSVAFNFHRSGTGPIKIDLPENAAADETLAYCTDTATRVLKDLLEEKYYSLVWFWTKFCVAKNQIVQPQVLPKYFEWGNSIKKTEAELFTRAIGNRGVWLSKFSKDWDFTEVPQDEFDWETANTANRVKFLETLRLTDPVAVVEKIRSAWKEENALARVELLSSLAVNISKADEDFLLSVSNEKSTKVKDKVLELLKLIPNSRIIQSFE